MGTIVNFVSAARTKEIKPGQAKSFQVNGHPVAIFNCAGKFYAISNICQHEGGFLAEGKLSGKIIMCPLHGWEYNVETGECLTAPGAELRVYPLQIIGDQIRVAVD